MRAILTCTLVLLAHTAMVTEHGMYDRPVGSWSKLIEAEEESANLPAQYYLCGFQFQSLKWSRTVECRCYNGYYRWKRQRRCERCQQNYKSKTAGLRSVYCRKNNWNDQISKMFSTESTQASEWRNTYMCAKDHYAHGFAVRLANEFGTDLGLNGLKLRCSTINFNSTLEVEDGEKYPLSNLYSPVTFARFISSIQIKFVPSQKIVGLKANFEPVAIISKIQFSYKTPTQLEQYPVNIETQIMQNCGNQVLQSTAALSKVYEVNNIWKTNDTYVKDIILSNNIGFTSLYRELSASQSSVQASVSDFSFNKEMKILLSSPQMVIVLIEPRSRKTINFTAEVKKGIIPYTSVLTFSDQIKGDFILNYTVEGVWQGTVISSAPETKIRQTPATCESKTNLRI